MNAFKKTLSSPSKKKKGENLALFNEVGNK